MKQLTALLLISFLLPHRSADATEYLYQYVPGHSFTLHQYDYDGVQNGLEQNATGNDIAGTLRITIDAPLPSHFNLVFDYHLDFADFVFDTAEFQFQSLSLDIHGTIDDVPGSLANYFDPISGRFASETLSGFIPDTSLNSIIDGVSIPGYRAPVQTSLSPDGNIVVGLTLFSAITISPTLTYSHEFLTNAHFKYLGEVPEPATALLVVSGALLCAVKKRRGRR